MVSKHFSSLLLICLFIISIDSWISILFSGYNLIIMILMFRSSPIWPVGVLPSWLWCDGEFIWGIAFPNGLNGRYVREERGWGLVLSAHIYGQELGIKTDKSPCSHGPCEWWCQFLGSRDWWRGAADFRSVADFRSGDQKLGLDRLS